jgi:hypothetical protein
MPLVRDWELCRNHSCGDRLRVSSLRDPLFARRWLRQFKRDPAGLSAMRTFLGQGEGARPLFGVSDDDAIDQLADLLASGLIHIHTQPLPAARAGSGSSDTFAAQTPVPFPLTPQPKPTPQQAQPPAEPSTFPMNLAGPAQAAALMSAAAQGVPFCPE